MKPVVRSILAIIGGVPRSLPAGTIAIYLLGAWSGGRAATPAAGSAA